MSNSSTNSMTNIAIPGGIKGSLGVSVLKRMSMRVTKASIPTTEKPGDLA